MIAANAGGIRKGLHTFSGARLAVKLTFLFSQPCSAVMVSTLNSWSRVTQLQSARRSQIFIHKDQSDVPVAELRSEFHLPMTALSLAKTSSTTQMRLWVVASISMARDRPRKTLLLLMLRCGTTCGADCWIAARASKSGTAGRCGTLLSRPWNKAS